jgi:hypothetical protein
MKYPFKLKTNDTELNQILTILAHDRTVTVNGSKRAVKLLGYKIKPIRKDIFIGWDFRTKDTNISLKNPMLKMEIENLKNNFKKYTFKF